jgi:hypothetical protein
VGDSSAAETAGAVGVLIQQTDCHAVGDVGTAADLLDTGDVAPTLVVVAERYPGQIAHTDFDRLARLAPLTGFVALSCVWCEGDGRSGQPWPAARRVYWSHGEAYFRDQLRRIAAGQTPDWALPATCTADERHLLSANSAAARPPQPAATIVIQSDDRDMRDWLTAAMHAEGFAAVGRTHGDREPIRGAAAAVIDWPVLTRSNVSTLAGHLAAVAPARTMVLVDFPRPDMYEWLAAAGAPGLLARPLEISELTGQLRHLIEPVTVVEAPPQHLSLAG